MRVLETERLILRHLSPDVDAEFILALLNDPAFIRNIGDRKVRSAAEARAFIEKRPVASYRANGFGLYAVVSKESGEAIGMCGLIRRDELEDVDVGYALLPAHRGKGYAYEAASAVVSYAHDAFGLERVVAIVIPGNVESVRVLEKLGFRRESSVRIPGTEPEMELYASTGRAAGVRSGAAPAYPVAARVDHLVFATPDLERTVDDLERRVGVRATPGGRHPGRGSRNALLAIGHRAYLEIVGPDPEQPDPAQPRWFGIDALDAPRLVTWAAHADDLERVVANARRNGVAFGEPAGGGRMQRDGTELRWKFAFPTADGDGIVPFLIEWETETHPASTSAPGMRLVDLRAEHPAPHTIAHALATLQLALRVDQGARAALVATLETPKGRVELR